MGRERWWAAVRHREEEEEEDEEEAEEAEEAPVATRC